MRFKEFCGKHFNISRLILHFSSSSMIEKSIITIPTMELISERILYLLVLTIVFC